MTNYIIATWSGARKGNPKPPVFLKEHLERLEQLKHNCKVFIVFPYNPDEPTEHRLYREKLIRENKYTIIQQQNVGMSYYQWLTVMTQFPADYHIVIEDDYVPVVDHFDKILITLLKSHQCDYLCGLFEGGGAALSNGIISDKALEKATFPVKWGEYCVSQVQFSQAFSDAGVRMDDYLWEYQSQYADGNNNTTIFRYKSEADLIVPIQANDKIRLEYRERLDPARYDEQQLTKAQRNEAARHKPKPPRAKPKKDKLKILNTGMKKKIIIIAPGVLLGDAVLAPGSSLELPDGQANKLINSGVAEECKREIPIKVNVSVVEPQVKKAVVEPQVKKAVVKKKRTTRAKKKEA